VYIHRLILLSEFLKDDNDSKWTISGGTLAQHCAVWVSVSCGGL